MPRTCGILSVRASGRISFFFLSFFLTDRWLVCWLVGCLNAYCLPPVFLPYACRRGGPPVHPDMMQPGAGRGTDWDHMFG